MSIKAKEIVKTKTRGKTGKYTTESWKLTFHEKHGYDNFGTDRAIYKGSSNPIEILCLDCNNYWWPKPADMMFGKGCYCNRTARAVKTIQKTLSRNKSTLKGK